MRRATKLILIVCRIAGGLALSACGNSTGDDIDGARLASPVAAQEPRAPDLKAAELAQLPSDRNANIWSGKSHQPRRDDVETAEQNAGLASAGTERRLDDDVDRIGRQLQQVERHDSPGFLEHPPR